MSSEDSQQVLQEITALARCHAGLYLLVLFGSRAAPLVAEPQPGKV